MYVTCNSHPEYGDHKKDVEDRLEIMYTTAIPEEKRDSFAGSWIRDHSFECVLWMCKMMEDYLDLIPEEELFFVRTIDDYVPVKVIQNCDKMPCINFS